MGRRRNDYGLCGLALITGDNLRLRGLLYSPFRVNFPGYLPAMAAIFSFTAYLTVETYLAIFAMQRYNPVSEVRRKTGKG